jgi:hypothetical protein
VYTSPRLQKKCTKGSQQTRGVPGSRWQESGINLYLPHHHLGQLHGQSIRRLEQFPGDIREDVCCVVQSSICTSSLEEHSDGEFPPDREKVSTVSPLYDLVDLLSDVVTTDF